MPTELDLPLPDPVIEEVEDPASLDEWTPDFPIVRAGHLRVDSRRWLLLPDRYTYKPLRAMEAARAADALTAAPHGKALIALASRLMSQRRALEAMVRGEAVAAMESASGADDGSITEDDLQAEVDARVRDHAQLALEEFVGEARIELYPWALDWIARCEVHRVPLPSRREGAKADPGGFVARAKGEGEWTTYYAGRQVHVLRLGAACCWGSVGPFLVDLS